MSFIIDLINLIYFKIVEKKYLRIFFFESEFIEGHLEPYLNKNCKKEKTLIISFYKIKNKNLKKFKIITLKSSFFLEIFFLIIKTKYLYSSTPDLNNSIFKKSVFKKTKYIYLQHSPLSLKLIYTEKAFNSFDIIFVNNSYQKQDVSEINKLYNKNIKIWKSTYLFIKKKTKTKNSKSKKIILLAPTWGTDFYKKNLHYAVKKSCNELNLNFEIRPHYMSYKKNEINFDKISRDFQINSGSLDFNSIEILITDWSGIFIEYAYLKKKKCILINSTQKLLNKNINGPFENCLDIKARKHLGYEVAVNDINKIPQKIISINNHILNDKIEIDKFFVENFY
tara:strand:+ start:215 stop:1228 length:1014 start_codon:yes stop_codon:yes gene_type:complete